jgi:hypothetical protein
MVGAVREGPEKNVIPVGDLLPEMAVSRSTEDDLAAMAQQQRMRKKREYELEQVHYSITHVYRS